MPLAIKTLFRLPRRSSVPPSSFTPQKISKNTCYTSLTALTISVILCSHDADAVAAEPQYFQAINNLASLSSNQNPGVTASAVILHFYNGDTAPCLSVLLNYGQSISLATGGRSPCVMPVTRVSAQALTTPYGPMYAPLDDVNVASSPANFIMTIKSLTDPVFDVHNGAIISTGTGQISFTAM